MFTGIVREIGSVQRVDRMGDCTRLQIESKNIFKDVKIGGSVAVNGICLTVVENKNNRLSFDVTEETMRRTALKGLRPQEGVNLEGSLKAGDALGGHFVLGHVDCAGIVKRMKNEAGFFIEVEVPGEFSHLLVEKGSVAVDGVSLTIGEVDDNIFKAYLIPHTLDVTTLRYRTAGDEVNIEFDIIGKYVAKMKSVKGAASITEEFLKEKGF